MTPPTKVEPPVILLIDDEGELLYSLSRLLASEGWTVHTADDPIDGLRFYEEHWRQIDVVLVDYFMHIYKGEEVFLRLQRINPAVRVILMTGCDEEVGERLLKKGFCGFVQKPVSAQVIIQQIRDAMQKLTS